MLRDLIEHCGSLGDAPGFARVVTAMRSTGCWRAGVSLRGAMRTRSHG